MSNSIVLEDIASLLDSWIDAEKNGVQFPVPFEAAWRIAGYSTKANAKREIKNIEPQNVSSKKMNKESKNVSGVTVFEHITFSVDGLKDFCLFSKTEEGRLIRKYFIEAEKKWRLVQAVAPQVAEEVEILAMKIELAKIEREKAELESKALGLRQYIVEVLPKAKADRIMGITEIPVVEIRTKIVDENDRVLNAANTVSKTELANRYGFVSKSGRPDTKTVTKLIEEAIASNAIPNPWHDIRVVASSGFDAALIPVLDRFFDANPQQRQHWIGE